MRDMSLFFLKNSMGAKMRKGFRNLCNNHDSTCTLNQHPVHERESTASLASSSHNTEKVDVSSTTNNSAPPMKSWSSGNNSDEPRKSVTLEEMILQLELEEEMARRVNLDTRKEDIHRRMSCVNNSDILRSARHALTQYPRFSLDGRDAMYRSSFATNVAPTLVGHSVGCGGAYSGIKLGRLLHLPQTVGGESVVWCKPGVVPKLMGLEAMPVPVKRINKQRREKVCAAMRNQSLRRRQQAEKKVAGDLNGCGGHGRRGSGSCCVMNHVVVEPVAGLGGWAAPHYI